MCKTTINEPSKNEPLENEPLDEALKNEPLKNEPLKNEPLKNEPLKNEPLKNEPLKNEPLKNEPPKNVNGKTKKKRHGAKNQPRHKRLVRWLIEKFPQYINVNNASTANEDVTVLDVAGGKGELSSRLCLCHNTNVIMVDPRECKIHECYDKYVITKLPKKWQEIYREKIEIDPDHYVKEMNQKFHQLIMNFDMFTVEQSDELRDAINKSSLLIGMHADGATEAIVDVALKHKKPFIVVPCCVFPNFFQKRILLEDDGTSVKVRSYEQFCRYLVQKDERFVMETLPFEGRNIAIWWDGKD